MRDITQLVGDTLGIANDAVYIAVGMAIYPVFYRAVGDEIEQFHRECSIDSASLEHWVGQQV